MREHRYGTRAVHGLQRKNALVFGLRGEHILSVIEPVPRGLPETAVHHIRRVHLNIARFVLPLAHVIEQLAEQGPTLGMPENRAWRIVAEMEEIELSTDLAVISFLGLLELGEVLVQLLLIAPRGAIDALQRLVIGVTAPVGTGQLHQLKGLR